MNIVIKKMETDAEIKGKAYVHWKSWQEAYSGIVDQRYLDSLTLDKCEKIAFRRTDNVIIAKTAIPLLDLSALANIAMTNSRTPDSRTPEKFLLFIFYRSITEKALGIA